MKYLYVIVAVLAIGLAGWLILNDPEPQPVTEAVQPVDAVEPEEATEEEAASDEEAAQPVMVEESTGEVDEAEADRPIVLAQADTSAITREWKFAEGRHFTRMTPTQPTVGGADKIEVAEFFWYGCNHCFDFEPYINRWEEGLPANVRFVKIPALWNPLVKIHGQIYYTADVLDNGGKLDDREGFRNAVFLEIHRRGNRLASDSAIFEVFERFGVSREDFDSTWNSFEVAQKMRVAEDLARRYGIASVPIMAVNGKYKATAGDAGSYPALLEVVDELVEREATLR